MATKTKQAPVTRDDITTAYVGDIVKTEKTADGLMVYGKVTGPDIDLDGQICDPDWLKTAMPDWMVWGNVREQHGHIAAGVGKELTETDDGDWMLKALIVDPGTIKKVETGVLKGYSIHVKNASVLKDRRAPGGRICGGVIVENSLVDRPCLPTATMSIAKAYGADSLGLGPVDAAGVVIAKSDDGDEPDTEAEPVEQPAEPEPVEETPEPEPEPLSDEDQMAADALVAKTATVGSEHAKTVDVDLTPSPAVAVLAPSAYRKAVATAGRVLSGDIVKGTADETADIAGAQQVIAQLAALIISEATELAAGRIDEVYDIACLMDAVMAVKRFLQGEQAQDGTDTPDDTDVEPVSSVPAMGGDVSYVSLAADGDVAKRAFTQAQRDAAAKSGAAMPDGSYPIHTKADLSNAIHAVGRGKGDHAAIRRHIIARAKALGASSMIPEDWTTSGSKAAAPDGVPAGVTKDASPDVTELVKAVAAATEAGKASEERIKALEAELVKVRATPIPGGPMILSTGPGTPAQSSADLVVKRYLRLAEQSGNPDVQSAYRALAKEELAKTS